MRSTASLCVLALMVSCTAKPPSTGVHRAELRKVGAQVVEIVPAENQPAWCLVFTISEKSKIIRQLTMNRHNDSFNCPAGVPIGNLTFRIPSDEGPVKLFVFFSDQRLNAGSLAQQLYELSARPVFNVLDLRAPGKVVSEHFDFVPEEEPAPSTGAVVGAGGELQSDGGPAPASSADAGGSTPASPPPPDSGGK